MRARLGLAAAVLAVGAFGPMSAADAVCIPVWQALGLGCSPCTTANAVLDRVGAVTECLA